MALPTLIGINKEHRRKIDMRLTKQSSGENPKPLMTYDHYNLTAAKEEALRAIRSSITIAQKEGKSSVVRFPLNITEFIEITIKKIGKTDYGNRNRTPLRR